MEKDMYIFVSNNLYADPNSWNKGLVRGVHNHGPRLRSVRAWAGFKNSGPGPTHAVKVRLEPIHSINQAGLNLGSYYFCGHWSNGSIVWTN